MAGSERCMIYKTGPTIRPPVKNKRPSGPLCGCGATLILCECLRELERRPCCPGCDHDLLPPDIRPKPLTTAE